MDLNDLQIINKKFHSYLENHKNKFRLNFPSFPVAFSAIISKSDNYLEKNLAEFKLFFQTELHENNGDNLEEEIKNIFNCEITQTISNENFLIMMKMIKKNIQQFIEIISLENNVELDSLLIFLKDIDLNSQFSLKALKDEKKKFFPLNDNLKILKKIVNFEKKNQNQNDKTYVQIIHRVSENLAQLLIFVVKYVETIFEKMGYSAEFMHLYQHLNFKYMKKLLSIFKSKESKIFERLQSELNLINDNIILKFDESLREIKENHPKIINLALDNFHSSFIAVLIEDFSKIFGYKPSSLLISQINFDFTKRLKNQFYEICGSFFVTKRDNYYVLEERVAGFFEDYLMRNSNIFERIPKNERSILLTTMISSLFSEELTKTQYIDNMSFILNLKNNYFQENTTSELEKIFFYIRDFENYQENLSQIKKTNKESIDNWSKKIDEDLNLYAIFSLIMSIQNIKVIEKNANDLKEDKKKILIGEFNTKHHIKIKKILRNLNDLFYDYSNYELLLLIEYMISRMMFPYENEILLKLNNKNSEFYKRINSNFVFEYEKAHQNVEFLQDIRNSHQETIEKKWNILLKRIEDLQIKKDFIPCPRFEFDKLSKIETRSRIINICISGFLSQDSSKRKEWADLVDICDRNNSELLTIKWLSSTEGNLFEFMSQSFMDLKSLVSLKSYLPALGLGALRLFSDNPFFKAFDEAKMVGFYLAHLLGDLKIFGNCAINFIGFSMGTIVIFECLLELSKMRRHDIVYNVIVMGSIISKDEIEKINLNMISGHFFHCFSKKDLAIKYLFRLAKMGQTAIGVKPILGNPKILNINCSNFIDGHMKYRQKMKEVLDIIDFNKDLNYLLNGLFEFN